MYRQIGIALRKSGSVDFYYDFKLVESSQAIPEKRIYIGIDCDFNDLHFKCYEKSDDPTNPYEKVVQYCCNTTWKQRIGILSSYVHGEGDVSEIRGRLQKYLVSLQADANLRHSLVVGNLQEALKSKHIKQILDLDADTFTIGLHSKVSGYLKLYSSFINAGRKFILAHNQFVSIFNLAKDQWTSHNKFTDTVRQIFRNRHSGQVGDSQ